MYHTTGFTKDEIIDLCAMVCSAGQEPGLNHWPPVLGLFKSVVVALTYMRRNRVQAELAETYGVSQPQTSGSWLCETIGWVAELSIFHPKEVS